MVYLLNHLPSDLLQGVHAVVVPVLDLMTPHFVPLLTTTRLLVHLLVDLMVMELLTHPVPDLLRLMGDVVVLRHSVVVDLSVFDTTL